MEKDNKIKNKSPIRLEVVYFAWLRQHIGRGRETIEAPRDTATVADLVDFLKKQTSGHARALKDMQTVRVAVNRHYGGVESAIAEGDEIAFFPPVTGG